jgi:diacylglycerol kinase (ATP)
LKRLSDFIRSRIHSFGHAFRGWWHVIHTQKNAWIHAIFTMFVILVGLWLGISLIEWAVLFVTICMVWMAEFLNTALEAVVDLASPEHHPLAKVGKDVGAAAVLIAAITSVIVGGLILGPHLWTHLGILGFYGK